MLTLDILGRATILDGVQDGGHEKNAKLLYNVILLQEKIHISFFEACFLILYFHVVSVYM